MTKEEAIEILSNMAWSAGSVDRNEILIAVSMAIKALKGESNDKRTSIRPI